MLKLRNMIKAVLIDLSGTLHIEDSVIPGAVEALNRLRKSNLSIKFVTNTTKESQNVLYQRLTKLGFTLKPEEIYSSLGAARNLIIERNLHPMLMIAKEAMEDFTGLGAKPGENPDSVLIGLAPEEFHYSRLTEAFRYLIDGAQLIAIHEGKYYKRSDGLALGPGCFVKGLEYSAQCKAELVGKPNKLFFCGAVGDISPAETVMIGDDVSDDIEGALKAGLQGYLVKTGKYRPGDEDKINPKPTAVCSSFVEAVDMLLKQIK